jgi:hypothetical protein
MDNITSGQVAGSHFECRKILHLWSGNPKIQLGQYPFTVNLSNQEVPYESNTGNPIVSRVPSVELEKKIR